MYSEKATKISDFFLITCWQQSEIFGLLRMYELSHAQNWYGRYGNFYIKVLFTVCYTKRQITALTFFLPLTNNWPHFFCRYKNNNKNCWERQNSLILKVKEWIQRSDSIQIWSRPAWWFSVGRFDYNRALRSHDLL